MTRPALFQLRYLPALLATALIPALSLLPAAFFRGVESSLPPVAGIDKWVHALMYAGLAGAYLYARPAVERARLKTVFRIAVLASLYGALMEICQFLLTSTRCMDPLDAAANTAGAFACAAVICVISRWRTRGPAV